VKVEIRSKDFSITAGMRSHTERRLAFALDRFSRGVKNVLVWVGDLNGPKGGADKSCRIAVELLRGRVVLEERGPDLYVAIDRAAHRAAAKVARDSDNIYFMAECAADITPYTDKSWMRLLIDIEGVNGDNRETFKYIVNRTSPTEKYATLEKSKGGWNWEKVGEVEYSLSGNRLQIKIPRAMLNIGTGAFTVNFKWSDNMQKDGDIMDFYVSGDVAPGGRFKYQYKA
jgi:ribosome-associated translation inhibitor RaiA